MSEPNSPSGETTELFARANVAEQGGTGLDTSNRLSAAWHSLPEETAKAYDAFRVYLSLPASERSVAAAYNRERQNTGKTPARAKQASGTWNYWATLYKWQERAKFYDEHLAEIERESRERERREQSKDKERRHLERLREYRENLHNLNAASLSASILLMQKAVARLEIADENEIKNLRIIDIANVLKAAAATATTASDAQAQALAVDEILERLDEPDGTEASE